MEQYYQRGTILLAYEGTIEELEGLMASNETIPVKHWACDGKIAVVIPETPDNVDCDDVLLLADHLQTGQFIHIQ